MIQILIAALLVLATQAQTVSCPVYYNGDCVSNCRNYNIWQANYKSCMKDLKEMPIRTDWTEPKKPHTCTGWSETGYTCNGRVMQKKSGVSSANACRTYCKEVASLYNVHEVCCQHRGSECLTFWNAAIVNWDSGKDSWNKKANSKASICTNGRGNVDEANTKYVDTFLRTGCLNYKPMSLYKWNTVEDDLAVLDEMYNLCVAVRGGTADRSDKRECCGAQFMCSPTCTKQTEIILGYDAVDKSGETAEEAIGGNEGYVPEPISEVSQVGLVRYVSAVNYCGSGSPRTQCDTGLCCIWHRTENRGLEPKKGWQCSGKYGGPESSSRCTPYIHLQTRKYTATWGCHMLDHERCCQYQDGRNNHHGPCVPARNVFESGNRCEALTYITSTYGAADDIAACPVPAYDLHVDDNGYMDFGIGGCRVNMHVPGALTYIGAWETLPSGDQPNEQACAEKCNELEKCWGYNYDEGKCRIWQEGPIDRFPGEEMSEGSLSKCMVKESKNFKAWMPFRQLEKNKQCNDYQTQMHDKVVFVRNLVDCKKAVEAIGGEHFNHEQSTGTCRLTRAGKGSPSELDAVSHCPTGFSGNTDMNFYHIQYDWEYLPWQKIQRGKRCKAAAVYLTKVSSLMECYELVAEQMRYTNQDVDTGYFMFGVRGDNYGQCSIVKTTNGECGEGYTDDTDVDFYKTKERKQVFNPRDACSSTAQELLDMGYTMGSTSYDKDATGAVIYEKISETPVSSVPAKVVDGDSASVEFSRTTSHSSNAQNQVGVSMTAGMSYTGGVITTSATASVEVSASVDHSWGSSKGWSESQTISYNCQGIGVGFEKECVIIATRSTYRIYMQIEFTHDTLPTCKTRFSRDFTNDWGIQNIVARFMPPCKDKMVCPTKTLMHGCLTSYDAVSDAYDFLKHWCIRSCGWCHAGPNYDAARPDSTMPCKKGDAVEAMWNDYNWYSATITAMSNTAITVEWDDDHEPKTGEICPEKVRKGEGAWRANECSKLNPDLTECDDMHEAGVGEKPEAGTDEKPTVAFGDEEVTMKDVDADQCHVTVTGEGDKTNGKKVGKALCEWEMEGQRDQSKVKDAIDCVLADGTQEGCKPSQAERHVMTELHVEEQVGGISEAQLRAMVESRDATEEMEAEVYDPALYGFAAVGALATLYAGFKLLGKSRSGYLAIP